jgi:hypothetical protein
LEPIDRFAISVGPYLGFRIGFKQHAKVTWEISGVPNERGYTNDVSSRYKSIDAGINVNLQYALVDGWAGNNCAIPARLGKRLCDRYTKHQSGKSGIQFGASFSPSRRKLKGFGYQGVMKMRNCTFE